MPLLHLQLKAPPNAVGTNFTDNPTFTPEFGHEFFAQPVTLRTVSISTFDGTAPKATVIHTVTPSHNTMWVDLLTDQQLNAREVNTNVADASSFPIPFDYSTMRDSTQQYSSLDYTFDLSHIEPGNGINIRVMGSDSNVNNHVRWSSDETRTDSVFQIDLTWEYAEIGGVD